MDEPTHTCTRTHAYQQRSCDGTLHGLLPVGRTCALTVHAYILRSIYIYIDILVLLVRIPTFFLGADPNRPLHEWARTDSFDKGVSRRRSRNSRVGGALLNTRRSGQQPPRRQSWILSAGDTHQEEEEALEALHREEAGDASGPATPQRRRSSAAFKTPEGPQTRRGSNVMKFDNEKIQHEMRAIFDDVDIDQDGAIGIEEFVKLIHNWNSAGDIEEEYSEEFVKEIFQEIDLDGNGELDFGEFTLAFESLIERSMHGDNSVSLTSPSHLTGIDAAHFKAATARVAALEHDLVKQKLQHLAEKRELKELTESTTDQLDESLIEMADQEKHFHTQERKLELQVQHATDQIEALTSQLEGIQDELGKSEADRTGGSKLHRHETMELEEQLIEMTVGRDELLEENLVFSGEVERLNLVVNELQLEIEEVTAILQQVQNDRRSSPTATELEDALAELDSTRERLDEVQVENEALHAQLDAYELLARKAKMTERSLRDSLANLAERRRDSYPSKRISLTPPPILEEPPQREEIQGAAQDIPLSSMSLSSTPSTSSLSTDFDQFRQQSRTETAALTRQIAQLEEEVDKMKAKNAALETEKAGNITRGAQQKWQSASDAGKLAKANQMRAAALAERDAALQQVDSVKYDLAQLQTELDKSNEECTVVRNALSAAEADAALSAAAAARAVDQLALQTEGVGAADAARATVAKVQAELEQAIADLQEVQQAMSELEKSKASTLALLAAEQADRKLENEATQAKLRNAEDALAEAALVAAAAPEGQIDWGAELAAVKSELALLKGGSASSLARAETAAAAAAAAQAAATKAGTEKDAALSDLAEALLKATKESARAEAAAAAAAKAKAAATKASIEKDAALSELAAALLGKTKAEMRADEERQKSLEDRRLKSTPPTSPPSRAPPGGSRRRSFSTSSFNGDDAARAAELDRKLELKMAELSKVKAELKAEKARARRAARNVEREHDRMEAVRTAAAADRAYDHLKHIQDSLATSRSFDGLLTQATTILYPTGLTQAEVEARLRKTPGTAVRMLGVGGNEYMVNTSDTSGFATSSSTEGGGSSISYQKDNNNTNTNTSATTNTRANSNNTNTNVNTNTNNDNNILEEKNQSDHDSEGNEDAGTRQSSNPHPWWLDAGPTTARAVRPRGAPPSPGGRGPAPAKSNTLGHTGRRTWNEDAQWFQDRNTPKSTPAVSTVGGGSVASEQSHPSEMSPQQAETPDLAEYDFVDATLDGKVNEGHGSSTLPNNGGGVVRGGDGGGARTRKPVPQITRLGGGPAVLGHAGVGGSGEDGDGDLSPSRGEQDQKPSNLQLQNTGRGRARKLPLPPASRNTLGLKLDLQESIML